MEADQTPDVVYELAANIIETNPKYGVAEVSTIGQDELVGHKQDIRISGVESNSTTNTTASSFIEKKIGESAAKAVNASEAPIAAAEQSADDFDNLQVAERADSANSADQFANAGDSDEDTDDDEDEDTQVQ